MPLPEPKQAESGSRHSYPLTPHSSCASSSQSHSQPGETRWREGATAHERRRVNVTREAEANTLLGRQTWINERFRPISPCKLSLYTPIERFVYDEVGCALIFRRATDYFQRDTQNTTLNFRVYLGNAQRASGAGPLPSGTRCGPRNDASNQSAPREPKYTQQHLRTGRPGKWSSW